MQCTFGYSCNAAHVRRRSVAGALASNCMNFLMKHTFLRIYFITIRRFVTSLLPPSLNIIVKII
jgi:hypothetical protein